MALEHAVVDQRTDQQLRADLRCDEHVQQAEGAQRVGAVVRPAGADPLARESDVGERGKIPGQLRNGSIYVKTIPVLSPCYNKIGITYGPI